MNKKASHAGPSDIPVSVTFRHLDSSTELRDYAEERVGKLTRFMTNPLEAQVVLDAQTHARQMAEISLKADGLTLIGTCESTDMMASIDGALDKIEVQLRRKRDQRGDHKAHPRRRPASSNSAPRPEPAEETADEAAGPRIATREVVSSRPISAEDAVMELESSGREFVVYVDAETEAVNVLYRLEDGNFGLIET